MSGLIQESNAAKKINTYPWKLDGPIWTVGSKLCAERVCHGWSVEHLCDKVKGIRFKRAAVIRERLGLIFCTKSKNIVSGLS